MKSPQERRICPRLKIQVVIDSPSLSSSPIDTADTSVGVFGFKIVVPQKPFLKTMVNCTLEVDGQRFENCEGNVVWVRERNTSPPTWEIGLTVDMVGGRFAHYELI